MSCLCFHRNLRPDMIVEYRLESGVLWAVYARCPVHDCQAAEPVAGVGLLAHKAGVDKTPAGERLSNEF